MAQAPRALRRRRSSCVLARLGGILLQIVSLSLPRRGHQYRRLPGDKPDYMEITGFGRWRRGAADSAMYL